MQPSVARRRKRALWDECWLPRRKVLATRRISNDLKSRFIFLETLERVKQRIATGMVCVAIAWGGARLYAQDALSGGGVNAPPASATSSAASTKESSTGTLAGSAGGSTTAAGTGTSSSRASTLPSSSATSSASG